MVLGVEMFADHFQDYLDQYTIIGGFACDLLMRDAGFTFRATKDIDMVLTVEALTPEFITAFWAFIQDGGYQIRQKKDGKPVFYRFQKPTNPVYPVMIELFSRAEATMTIQPDSHLTPLHIDDEVSSLSAILLDEDYYRFIQTGRVVIDGISVLDAAHIIPLKMKAWLDLSERKANGASVDSREINKHRLDVFRLYALLSDDQPINVPIAVRMDITEFINVMKDYPMNLEDIGIHRSKESFLELYKKIYL